MPDCELHCFPESGNSYEPVRTDSGSGVTLTQTAPVL